MNWQGSWARQAGWVQGWRRVAAVGLVAMLVAATGCGDDDDDAADTTTTASTSEDTVQLLGQPVVVQGRATARGNVAIEARDSVFNPTLITAPAGSRLKVEVRAVGEEPHTFTTQRGNLDLTLEAGEKASAEVTVPREGRLVFYCRYHVSETGMAGAIEAG